MNPAWRTLLALSGAGVLPLALAQALPPLTQADGALHPGWRYVGFPKQKAEIPPTVIEAGQADGQPAVQVVTTASYGSLVHDLKDAPPTRLLWRWRLDQPLTGGKAPPDLTTKAGDDAALKVCAMFDHPLDRVPFAERTVLRIARSVSGEALPAATVCYVWDSGRAAGLQGANPYTRRVRYISLRGSEAPTRQWLNESRDLARDFATLFADELPAGSAVPPVRTVLIGADSDNTASRSSGWVADLRGGPP
ncbi:DUF3047 domain-containing protein [Hydrogenophaga sp.]|uniref:DUF3047 domain-containing protein n=1 Tax=Hydrogenophaga sp. TaxID=1904254 RepID=UPI00286D76B1|nr:DUF3047 domain-containing protein [Hydrogenophaga sp.]